MDMIIQRAAMIFKKDPAELDENVHFINDLNAKSVNVVQIITMIEAEYDVQVNYMQVRRKETIGEVADYVAELCGG
ncbi:MAG: acyl carrier protein [Desulfatitalea sp.]|nr:acyl carrier protein [Desulfatitalea sp.]